MRTPLSLAALVVLVAAGLFLRDEEAAANSNGQAFDQTTLDDQSELGLTVYNSDLALVRDVRNLQLRPGSSELRFMDIAATVNPSTVHIRSLSEPSRLSV